MKQTTRRAVCALFLVFFATKPFMLNAQHDESSLCADIDDGYDPFAEDEDPFTEEKGAPQSCIERLKEWGLSWYYKAGIGLNIAKVKARRWWHKKGSAGVNCATSQVKTGALTAGALGAGASVALLLGHLYNKKNK